MAPTFQIAIGRNYLGGAGEPKKDLRRRNFKLGIAQNSRPPLRRDCGDDNGGGAAFLPAAKQVSQLVRIREFAQTYLLLQYKKSCNLMLKMCQSWKIHEREVLYQRFGEENFEIDSHFPRLSPH